ncbi:hypothetical protein AGMMS50276_25340 [Synergistales bacterium]|nr:hypothetical protein AGMMS50276_25340 [Synergistales bacterium]
MKTLVKKMLMAIVVMLTLVSALVVEVPGALAADRVICIGVETSAGDCIGISIRR